MWLLICCVYVCQIFQAYDVSHVYIKHLFTYWEEQTHLGALGMKMEE